MLLCVQTIVCEYWRAVREFESKREKEIIGSRNIISFYKYINSRLHSSKALSVLKVAGFYVLDDNRAEVFSSDFSSVNVDDGR